MVPFFFCLSYPYYPLNDTDLAFPVPNQMAYLTNHHLLLSSCYLAGTLLSLEVDKMLIEE